MKCASCGSWSGLGARKGCGACGEYNLEQVDLLIADIKKQMEKPNYKPQTSKGVRARADRLRDMRTSIIISEGESRLAPEYQLLKERTNEPN